MYRPCWVFSHRIAATSTDLSGGESTEEEATASAGPPSPRLLSFLHWFPPQQALHLSNNTDVDFLWSPPRGASLPGNGLDDLNMQRAPCGLQIARSGSAAVVKMSAVVIAVFGLESWQPCL